MTEIAYLSGKIRPDQKITQIRENRSNHEIAGQRKSVKSVKIGRQGGYGAALRGGR